MRDTVYTGLRIYNMSQTQEITNKIWAMANELRGNMDASEYKNYILAFMFYRYLSEHQEQYLINNDILDLEDGKTINQLYKEQATGEELADYLEDIASSLGYAIAPEDTWLSLLTRIENNEVIPSDYQTIFDHFNANAELNKEAVQDFRGVLMISIWEIRVLVLLPMIGQNLSIGLSN